VEFKFAIFEQHHLGCQSELGLFEFSTASLFCGPCADGPPSEWSLFNSTISGARSLELYKGNNMGPQNMEGVGLTQPEAIALCEEKGMTLGSILSEAEFETVASWLEPWTSPGKDEDFSIWFGLVCNKPAPYICASDEPLEARELRKAWAFVSGRNSSYAEGIWGDPWGQTEIVQPDNWGATQGRCAVLSRPGGVDTWSIDDTSCERRLPLVMCETGECSGASVLIRQTENFEQQASPGPFEHTPPSTLLHVTSILNESMSTSIPQPDNMPLLA
jgi:hypothetical protein